MAKDSKKDTAKGMESQTEAKQTSGLPLFYNTITLLNKNEHDKLKLAKEANYAFAKNASSVVLMASEFSQAASDYPIVFGKSGELMLAFAVLGHTDSKNAYVDDKNKWRENTYIPAYIRRYPFILVQSEDGKQMSLAVDASSDLIGVKSGADIYKDGEPSDVAKRALSFCANYSAENERTKKLLTQIEDSGILIERSAEVTLPDKSKQRVVGFSIVDEKALAELDDKKFLELRKSGALNLIYSHLWSMRAWNNLLD